MEKAYLISDAAKQVQVETHVLRYWEEELGLPIKRNKLGHRYYTEGDVDFFKEVKKMKDSGIQLKAIRMYIKDGKIINTIEFDYWFSEVKNICVDNNRLIIGMDKVVAIVNLETKEIKAYTPISTEAEKDILKTKDYDTYRNR